MLTKNNLDLEFEKQLYAENNKEKINIIRELLSKGVNPNMKMNNESTALHFAAKDDDLQLFNLLLEFGGDINIQNCYHETPLAWAVFNKKYKTIELIVNHNDFDANTIFLKMWGKHAWSSLTQTTDDKILFILKDKIAKLERNKIKEEIEQKFEEKNLEKINTISIKHEKIKPKKEQLIPNRKKCIII